MRRIVNLSLLTLSIVFTYLSYIVLSILAHSDVSEQKPYKTKHNVHFISYSDGRDIFIQNQHMLTANLINKGFRKIYEYSRQDISKEFYEENKEILETKFGAGLWLWKPYLILKTLEAIPEGDVVFYLDSGFTMTAPPEELLEKLDTSDMVLTLQTPIEIFGVIKSVCKREVLINMDADDPKIYNQPGLIAGFGIYRNTQKVREFVKDWLAHAVVPGNLDTNYDIKIQHSEFISHMNDQAILNLVNVKRNIGQSLVEYDDFYKSMYWHHRNKALYPFYKLNRDDSLFASTIRGQRKISKLSRVIYNSILFSWYRGKVREKYLL